MRPFFSYYGAKYTASAHLGPPRRDLVIEPFAGSACYSTRWNVRRARLYDVSPDICALWDFLIHASDRDIRSIPDSFDDIDDVMELPLGPQLLVRFWVSKGRAEPTGALSPWYFKWRNSRDCRVWGPSVKARILSQKARISEWTIEQACYRDIPIESAHWHVDPPYNNFAGSRYPHSDLDFDDLAKWCRSLPGSVDVCENSGARWLPFEDLCKVVTSRGRKSGAISRESVWRSDPAPTAPQSMGAG